MSTLGIQPSDHARTRPPSVVSAPLDGRPYESRYQRPESSAAASSSSHRNTSRLDTTVTNIRIARPERDIVAQESGLQDVKPVVEAEAEQKVKSIETRGKTKAEIMRQWRKSQGKLSSPKSPRGRLTNQYYCKVKPREIRICCFAICCTFCKASTESTLALRKSQDSKSKSKSTHIWWINRCSDPERELTRARAKK